MIKTSKLGIDLIKHFEKERLEAYLCPANKWTIGYGHTGSVDGQPVSEGMTISSEKATQLLQNDIARFENTVNSSVKVPLSQNQFDALVVFTFNVGSSAFRTSTLLELLNQGKYEEVPTQLLRWNKSKGKVLAGLVRRRRAEGHLWTTGGLKFYF